MYLFEVLALARRVALTAADVFITSRSHEPVQRYGALALLNIAILFSHVVAWPYHDPTTNWVAATLFTLLSFLPVATAMAHFAGGLTDPSVPGLRATTAVLAVVPAVVVALWVAWQAWPSAQSAARAISERWRGWRGRVVGGGEGAVHQSGRKVELLGVSGATSVNRVGTLPTSAVASSLAAPLMDASVEGAD